jgi:hypothetical protein
MMEHMRRLGLLVLLVSSLASAQTPRALFDEGTALYSKGDFAGAAQKFEASFAARPVPVTKFNIARAWEQAGETIKAIDAWQAWLAMSPASPERPNAEQSLAALGQKLAKLGVQALTITSLPVGARVSVDGRFVGLTPVTVELTPTRHLLRLDVDGRVPVERPIVVSLERPSVEAFELAPGGEAPPPMPFAVTQPTPLPAPMTPRPIDAAFASTLAVDAVQVHIDTPNREVRLYRANGNPNGECRTPCDTAISRASDVFFVGGTGLATSPTFVLLDHAQAGRVSLKVTPGNGGFILGGALLLSGGIAGLVSGLLFAILPVSDKALPVGISLSVGVGGLIGGIVMLASGGTKVAFE